MVHNNYIINFDDKTQETIYIIKKNQKVRCVKCNNINNCNNDCLWFTCNYCNNTIKQSIIDYNIFYKFVNIVLTYESRVLI